MLLELLVRHLLLLTILILFAIVLRPVFVHIFIVPAVVASTHFILLFCFAQVKLVKV